MSFLKQYEQRFMMEECSEMDCYINCCLFIYFAMTTSLIWKGDFKHISGGKLHAEQRIVKKYSGFKIKFVPR